MDNFIGDKNHQTSHNNLRLHNISEVVCHFSEKYIFRIFVNSKSEKSDQSNRLNAFFVEKTQNIASF